MIFNAGEIETRLTLDRDPFNEGLDEAEARADEFDSRDIEPTIRLDDGEMDLQLDELSARLDEVTRDRDINIRPDVDQAAMASATAETKALGDSADGASSHFGLLAAGIAALLPVVGPLAAEVVGAASALGVAGIGLAAFGGAAFAAIEPLKNASTAQNAYNLAVQKYGENSTQAATALKALNQEVKSLTPAERELWKATDRVKEGFSNWGHSLEGVTLPVLSQGLRIVLPLLHELNPLVQATAGGLSGALTILRHGLISPEFRQFIDFISDHIRPVLHSLATDFVSLGSGVATLFESSLPALHGFLGLLSMASSGLGNMASSPVFRVFMGQMATTLPLLNNALRQIFDLVGNIIAGLEPAMNPVLRFITTLATSLSDLASGGALSSIATLFGDILDALSPLLPLIATLANTLIPPLANALDILVQQGLAPFLSELVKSGAIQNLATAFADLMVAVTPLIPPLAHLLVLLTPAVVTAINLVAQLVDDIAQNRVVVDIIEGIALAWAAWTVAAWALDAALDANPIGVVILALAALAIGIDQLVRHWSAVVDFLQGPWGTAISAAIAVIFPFIGIPMLIIGHWRQIIGFFEHLWHSVAGFFEHNWRTIVKVLLGIVLWPYTIIKYWSNIVGFFHGLWNRIVSAFVAGGLAVAREVGQMPGQIERFVGRMGVAGVHLITGFWTGLKSMAGEVLDWFGALPGKIISALGDLGSLLWDAGKAIMNGLKNGIEDGIKGVLGTVGGVAGKIARLKGPLDYDRILLIPHGNAIMDGLHEGILSGVGRVLQTVGGIAPKLSGKLSSATLADTHHAHHTDGRHSGDGGERRMRLVSGELKVGRDASGELRAWVQDIVAEEADFHDAIAGMA